MHNPQLNPDVNAFQRKFVSEVRRCSEMERKLRYLEEVISKEGIPLLESDENPKAPLPKEMVKLEVNCVTIQNLDNFFFVNVSRAH